MGKNKMDEVIKIINNGSATGSNHATKIELEDEIECKKKELEDLEGK